MKACKRGLLRIAGLICCGATLAIGMPSGAGAAPGSEEDAVPAESVYVVEARNADGTVRRGSAVAIGRDSFVTSCHVTRRAEFIVIARGAYTWRATLQAGSGELDVCILSAHFAAAPAPHLRKTASVAVGEPIYAVGFPVGQAISVRAGTIKALHQHENSSVIQVSAAWELGSSGGGLFDRQGNLVGILAFKMLAGEGQYFALPTEWISRVQQSAPPRASAREDAALAFWEQPREALPPFLQKIALDPLGSRGAGTSGSAPSGRDR